MKTGQCLFAIIFAACALCACSSGSDDNGQAAPDEPAPTGKLPITISTSVSGVEESRVTDYAFETGDEAGLYVVNRRADGSAAQLLAQGNHVDNMHFTYNGTWTPDSPIYWLDNETHADFYLYYPYKASVADVEALPFSVAADQSTEAAYKSGDVVIGSALNVAPTESAVSIEAKHVMSQMLVTLEPGNGFTEESLAAADVQVKINGVKTAATANLSTATVTATGSAATVTPLHVENAYKALVVPQSVAESNLITVTVDGRDFNLKKAFTFVSGKRHRFTVTLSKTSSGVNVDINPWEDDGTDNGGVAE